MPKRRKPKTSTGIFWQKKWSHKSGDHLYEKRSKPDVLTIIQILLRIISWIRVASHIYGFLLDPVTVAEPISLIALAVRLIGALASIEQKKQD